MMTKVKTGVESIEVDGRTLYLFWDNASALDLAESMGIDDINELQIRMADTLGSLTNENGGVNARSLKSIAKMIHVAILTGFEHVGLHCDMSQRDTTNLIMSDSAVDLVEAFARVLGQYMPQGDESEQTESKKKAGQKREVSKG